LWPFSSLGLKTFPGIGKGLGEAIRGFKKALNEDEADSAKLSADSKKENERKPSE